MWLRLAAGFTYISRTNQDQRHGERQVLGCKEDAIVLVRHGLLRLLPSICFVFCFVVRGEMKREARCSSERSHARQSSHVFFCRHQNRLDWTSEKTKVDSKGTTNSGREVCFVGCSVPNASAAGNSGGKIVTHCAFIVDLASLCIKESFGSTISSKG